MKEIVLLKDAYNHTKFQLTGHGNRNVRVLQEAFQHADGETESDMYGKGKVIEDFQKKMAAFLGKESAVFFPSGTMAQQIALRIWCDEKGSRRAAYHPLSHLEIHEEDGLKELHHIETVLLGGPNRVPTLEDIAGMEEGVSCVLLELPQREIGGQLPDFETLEQISAYCHKNGIRLHLDGARLLEVLPYYEKQAAEVCALFDSVYLSLYKGIGGIAGAILAGNKDFSSQSKVWKRRHGGDLISLYPYIIPADYYFDMRKNNMHQYYEDAKELAELFNACFGISTLPPVPVSNMFHVHIHHPKKAVEPILSEVQKETSIGITGSVRDLDENTCSFEVSLGDAYKEISKEHVNRLFRLLDEKMKERFHAD